MSVWTVVSYSYGLPIHILFISVVEPELEPQGAGTFGWSRSQNTEVSAPAPGQTQVVYLIIIPIE